jgi:hypothetical protein
MRKFENLKIEIIFFLFALITVISACDKVEPPYKENHTTNNDTTTYVQKVLIEDFTGHRCGNCPRAHEKLTELIGIYGNKVVGIAIHGGFFAEPLSPDYPDDFRTDEGTELTNTFGVTTWPIGMVNRTPQSGSLLLAYDAWAEPIAAIISQQPKAYITIQASLNTSNNTATSTIIIKLLQDLPDSLKLCAYLTEDSIIAAQTDYAHTPNLIPNYVQNHVLRKSFNGTWGTDISLTNKQTGDTIQRSFSLTWNSAWNSKHCHVISFIYKSSNNQIVQVNESAVQ